MTIINLPLPSYLDSKDCLVLAITDDGHIHASWVIENAILCFERLPEDYPPIKCLVWTNEKEYLNHIEKIPWIADCINKENTNLKKDDSSLEGLDLPRFLRASLSFLENLKKKED